MPTLTIKAIHSFSSEDPLFPASNILGSTTSTAKKWKCQLPGESSAILVLQLEKPSTISGIDIGNEHSAFVEVLVSKSGSSEFKQILLASSFMTPIESRNSDPTNRVRCFGKSALIESVIESKWDYVKVVCTQPFNKHVQYGLSFIKLHSPVEANKDHNDQQSLSLPKILGNFKIREDSPDSESESPQSLFARWKISRNSGSSTQPSTSLSAAAAIRQASTPTSLKNHSSQINRSKITPKTSRLHASNQQDDDDTINNKSRNRSELMYEDEDDKPNDKLDKLIDKEKERLERQKIEKKNAEKKRKPDKNGPHSLDVTISKFKDDSPSSAFSSNASKNSTDKPTINNDKKLVKIGDNPVASTSRKRQSSPINTPNEKRVRETKERVYKPFYKLLEGVVLVISGIQNPTRATIRKQALDMGAKYKPDWEATCTHLICAFKNTPKYNQVQGHGKIITKDWISECYSKKIRLPWRRFALDSNDAAGSESEEEIYDNSLKPSESSSQRLKDSNSVDHKKSHKPASPKKLSQESSKSHSRSPSKNLKSPKKSPEVLSSDDESLDRYNLNSSRTERNIFISSGSDTEDEIRRVLEKKNPSTIPKSASSDDIYNVTTEEEKETNTNNPNCETLTPLPEFFKGKRFYLSRNINSTDEIKLKRFIAVYGGQLTLVSSESDYIISNSPKDISPEFKGEVVKPLWIFECNDLEMLLPTKRYNFSNW